jgi:hypothetical protein
VDFAGAKVGDFEEGGRANYGIKMKAGRVF